MTSKLFFKENLGQNRSGLVTTSKTCAKLSANRFDLLHLDPGKTQNNINNPQF
jgi:hypothetical protein